MEQSYVDLLVHHSIAIYKYFDQGELGTAGMVPVPYSCTG
jgi:hypothetical protein